MLTRLPRCHLPRQMRNLLRLPLGMC
ncbi:hypothetical protein SUNI508_14119, partial [Seiridium unicorne]